MDKAAASQPKDNRAAVPEALEAAEAFEVADERSPVIQARFQKAQALAETGCPLYPNTFRPRHQTDQVRAELGALTAEELEGRDERRTLAGRLMARRDYGKSAFFDLQDHAGKIQLYVRRDRLGPEAWELVRQLDLGDLVGVTGTAFKTKTGELTLLVSAIELTSKALWPLPEKFHELSVELKYRRRYVDLIMSEESRRIFKLRSTIVSALRSFMAERGFLEVETPMMHPIPGGAAAKPFETHHNALDRRLYLRIAPELYLKRLLVGGFDRVFELNRNFRNEGLSVQHNPEFTMMEFYQSYADYEDLMTLTEEMLLAVVRAAVGGDRVTHQGREINLAPPWPRTSFLDSLTTLGGAPEEVRVDREAALTYLASLGGEKSSRDPLGKIQAKIFDLVVEPKLQDPTFVVRYPADISPLARRSADDPSLTDRFELFVTGRELANGFSELNDPLDQRRRFLDQVAEREAGDEESMRLDEDYVRALMHGMPPAAGEGLGVDRLVMLLTGASSIKDVILFPQMRHEG
ncbi:MAG: lysine--tRNA ligase [Deltaproteobacteria bacterium]|jgi:lysyl-tRNA synthetase class 2|nr:lysine--tRNA ligase [Deltaproteobacteria bacterium]